MAESDKENRGRFNQGLVGQLRTQLTNQKKHCSEILASNQSLQGQVEHQERKIAEISDELRHLRNENSKIDKENKHLLFKMKYLEEEKINLTQHNQTLSTYVRKLEAKLRIIPKSQQDGDRDLQYSELIEALQRDVERLMITNEELEIIRQSNTEELTRLEIENIELNRQLDSRRRSSAGYINQQNPSQHEHPTFGNNQVIEMQQEVQEALAINQLLETTKGELELKCKQLNRTVEQLMKFKFKTTEAMQHIRSVLLSTSSSRELVDLIDDALGQHVLEDNEDMDQIATLRSENERLRNQVRNLNQKVVGTRLGESESEIKIGRLEEQLENMKQSRSSAQKQFLEQMMVLRKENQRLTCENEKLSQDRTQLKEENLVLQQTIHRQERELQMIQM